MRRNYAADSADEVVQQFIGNYRCRQIYCDGADLPCEPWWMVPAIHRARHVSSPLVFLPGGGYRCKVREGSIVMKTTSIGPYLQFNVMDQLVLAVQLAAAGKKETVRKQPRLSVSDEAVLYERFLAGDDAACLELFQRYNQRLYTYCVKMVNDLEHAEDITQDVWRRLIELRAAGRQLQNPVGFLMRIARNLCLDHIKASRRFHPLESVHESALPSYTLHEPSEMEELVVIALQKLKFDYREVLVLYHYCGYSYDEIAKTLGKTSESIWTRASRARSQLRKLINIERDLKNQTASRHDSTGGRKL